MTDTHGCTQQVSRSAPDTRGSTSRASPWPADPWHGAVTSVVTVGSKLTARWTGRDVTIRRLCYLLSCSLFYHAHSHRQSQRVRVPTRLLGSSLRFVAPSVSYKGVHPLGRLASPPLSRTRHQVAPDTPCRPTEVIISIAAAHQLGEEQGAGGRGRGRGRSSTYVIDCSCQRHVDEALRQMTRMSTHT